MAVMILVVTAGFLVHDLGAGGALATLGVQTVSAITTFASIYHDAGFVQNGHPSWADSFYFSIVTWTTLGYGDFTILPPFHLVAAAEAMLGYLCFGLIVSFLSAAAIRSG
ncbi:MAG: hypothetical protein JOZ90_17385 [Alphaproteobacteria bacterium]|nr:hypothetical protein [Alphaproteobacteria bacterium]MBV9902845.1 hypothetical protein [Alphaproteobacteria bacterium]